MAWVGFDENYNILAYGENGKCPKWFSRSLNYDSIDDALDKQPKLKEFIKNSITLLEESKIDISYDVSYARSAKAMEAMLYRAGSISSDQCPMCLGYAKSEGISFVDAISKVWIKYQSAANNETERTTKKSQLRKKNLFELSEIQRMDITRRHRQD